ncbi:MAG: PASTA domain-containing protein [Eubacteriaceae bacterium]|nr:PASTA domain-containing protein [Eubacteriaceae bacterium]
MADFLNNYGKGDDSPTEDFKAPERRIAPRPQGGGPPRGGRGANSRIKELFANKVVRLGAVAFGCLIMVIGIVSLFSGVKAVDMANWRVADAQLWAAQNGVNLQVEYLYNDAIEADKVISQDVVIGAKVKKGAFFPIKVSQGHDMSVTLQMPDFTGANRSQVEAWQEENFMSKVYYMTESSKTVASGKVIRYRIGDESITGTVIRRDTPVYITVARGEGEAELVKVIDFKGKTHAEAMMFAQEAGITIEVNEVYDDYIPLGIIISQDIAAEQTISKGSVIIIIVSKGKKIVVPDFSSMTESVAIARASQLGISPVVERKYSPRQKDAFVSQSIPAGQIYDPSKNILVLTYSLGNTIPVPSFVDKPMMELEIWADDLNLKGADITIWFDTTQSNKEKGTILSQDRFNIVAGIDITIHCIVSSGDRIFVPDFTLLRQNQNYQYATVRDEAIAICSELGLVPVFEQDSNWSWGPGEIWDQSIPAGAEAIQNAVIVLWFNPAQMTMTMPSFTSRTWTVAEVKNAYSGHFRLVFVDEQGYSIREDYINETYAVIIRQNPVPGTIVEAGTTVTLTVQTQESEPPSGTKIYEPTTENIQVINGD